MDADGRSTFVSDAPVASAALPTVATGGGACDADQQADVGGDAWAEVWVTDPTQGLDAVVDPHGGPMALEPPAGGSAWRVFEVPPDAVMRERMAQVVGEMPGMEADGFHTTDTVDLVMVLEGEIVLELDTGEVSLAPGDCVVQRQTRHAWRNRSDRPVRMMAVMLSLRPT